MSAPECARCGDPVDNKDAAGHYREHCWSCILAIADEREPAGEIDVEEVSQR